MTFAAHAQRDRGRAVDQHESEHREDHAMVDHHAAERHRLNRARMCEARHLAPRLLRKDEHPHHLDAAAGRARTGRHDREQQHEARCEHGPGQVVDSRKTGRTADRDGVEHAVAKRIHHAVGALRPQHQRHQQAAADQHDERGAQFRVAPEAAPVSLSHRAEIQREVAAGRKHKKNCHPFEQWRCEVRKARVVRRESAQAHRSEHVHHRVNRRHATGPVCEKAGRRKCRVDTPEPLGGVLHARRDLAVLDGAGHLGLEELAAAHA